MEQQVKQPLYSHPLKVTHCPQWPVLQRVKPKSSNKDRWMMIVLTRLQSSMTNIKITLMLVFMTAWVVQVVLHCLH